MICRLENRALVQSIPTSTITALQFDTVAINSIGAPLIASASPWSAIPVFFNGIYMVTATIGLDSGTTGARYLAIDVYSSGTSAWTTVASQYVGATSTTGVKSLSIMAVVQLSTAFGEQVRASVWQNQGTAISTSLFNATTRTPVPSLTIAPTYITT